MNNYKELITLDLNKEEEYLDGLARRYDVASDLGSYESRILPCVTIHFDENNHRVLNNAQHYYRNNNYNKINQRLKD
tara:strand:- start:31 stop:261 length:231 start_codon:yes stop_codon:yes gene_type:complete